MGIVLEVFAVRIKELRLEKLKKEAQSASFSFSNSSFINLSISPV
jgi:hypothetical protein